MDSVPRGGSKKGEHRGGAKRGGRQKGSKNKRTLELEREIAIELGQGDLSKMPKEVLLEGMRHFFDTAMRWHKENNRLVALAEQAVDPVVARELRGDAHAAEGKFERYLILSGDFAYKAAPMCHARLQAIIVDDGRGKSAGSIMQSLLDEIDQSMRNEQQQFLLTSEHDGGQRTEH